MRVAVIGAAGYVGLSVCKELVRRGHAVMAVARANGGFLLDGIGAELVSPGSVGQRAPADVVVNLAYPNRGPAFEYPSRNREILGMIKVLAGSAGRVVHTSTQAVFGFDLEATVSRSRVRPRRDFAYIEAKIGLENLLVDAFPTERLDIVRLGNVWGPASPTWTAALADKLYFGEPVGVMGHDGFCNATDVGNVADYLGHLVDRRGVSSEGFHHLAELGELRWSSWIALLSDRLQAAPVYVSRRPAYVRSFADELATTWRRHSPFAIAREWMYGRMSGSVYRSVVRAMPRALHPALKRTGRGGASRPLAESGDPIFLTLMSSPRRFELQVDSDWRPVVDATASWNRILEWIAEAGY